MAPTFIMLRKIPFPPPLQTVYLHHVKFERVQLSHMSLGHDSKYPLWLTSEEKGEKEMLSLCLTDSTTFLLALT